MEHNLTRCETTHIVEQSADLCCLADAFIASCDVVHESRMTYRRALKAFFTWISSSGRVDRVNALTRFDMLAYKEDLGRTKSVATANLYLFVVRSFYAWLAENRLCRNITNRVRSFRVHANHAKDCLTVDQLRSILRGIDCGTVKGKRDYALVNLMARTGLRDIEVARARICDLRDKAGSSVLWVQGKGRAEADAFVLLVPEALLPIKKWLAAHVAAQGDAPLFPALVGGNAGGHMTSRSISRIVKQAMRRVGIDSDRLTPHSLRHTAISLAIEGGASLIQAQAMARHTKPETTMVYFHNANRIQDAAEKCVNF
jgi:integrase/recombinase XerD